MKLGTLLALSLVPSLWSWQKDGVPIASGPNDQTEPRLAVLEGDIVVVYRSFVPSVGNRLRAARLDGWSGDKRWDMDVVDESSSQEAHQVAVDSRGMTWVAFERAVVWPPAVRVQRLNGGGVRTFGPLGMAISGVSSKQMDPRLCLDATGEGCYVAWTDYRSGDADVWAARVTAEGKVAWEVPVCTLEMTQGAPVVLPSGDGVLVFWRDFRENAPGTYGQRFVDSVPLWGENGKLMLPRPGSAQERWRLGDGYFHAYAVPDGKQGAIVLEGRSGQRVDTLGNSLWGTPVVAVQGYQTVTNGASGVMGCWGNYAWYDDPYAKVCVSQTDSAGRLVWGSDSEGLLIWTSAYIDTSGYETLPGLVDDARGGGVAVWAARRSGGTELLATRIDSAGGKVWIPEVVVSGLPSVKEHPEIVMVPSGHVVVWEDWRSGDCDLYAQFIDTLGRVGIGEERSADEVARSGLNLKGPNPLRDFAEMSFRIPSAGTVRLAIYDASGRSTRDLVNRWVEAGSYRVVWDARDAQGQTVPSGVYFCRLIFSGTGVIETSSRKLLLTR